MRRAPLCALLAFVALGGAGGSLIVGDPAWFAWTAAVGAVALIIWARTHDDLEPPPAAPPHLREIRLPAQPFDWRPQLVSDGPTLRVLAIPLPDGRICEVSGTPSGWEGVILAGREGLILHELDEHHRPIWPTDLGAPE